MTESGEAMAPVEVVRPDAPAPHEHSAELVQVDFDDTGQIVRELRCRECGETSFQ